MSHRVSFLLALCTVALVAVGGVLFATSHPAGASPAPQVSSGTDSPKLGDQPPDPEPASCTGCPGICDSEGSPCTCPNGQHGTCVACPSGFLICQRH